MVAIPVSVVVVSRHRPDHLRRCLLALVQLDYAPFEIVVVACPAGADVARTQRTALIATIEEFDEANISKARNIGIARSNGEVIAFIDDDAVPEPTWLRHLAAPFEDLKVSQAGGTTLGRNGISVQHAAAQVDGTGQTHPLPVSGTGPRVLHTEGDNVPRLHGTNMAVRRSVLCDHGGFDERFRFYLDETDLTRRIARSGGATVFVPKAVVHHASGASAMRRSDRVPLHLYEIGASSAVYHRKHLPEPEWTGARDISFRARHNWLVRLMQTGPITPDDVRRLSREWQDGYDDGSIRVPVAGIPILPTALGSVASRNLPQSEDLYLAGTRATLAETCRAARDLAEKGHRVTVFAYSATARYHRVTFTDEGYWLHTGGIFGREIRTEPIFRRARREARIAGTLARLDGIRSLDGPKQKKWAKIGK